jgi:hypothetical protein
LLDGPGKAIPPTRMRSLRRPLTTARGHAFRIALGAVIASSPGVLQCSPERVVLFTSITVDGMTSGVAGSFASQGGSSPIVTGPSSGGGVNLGGVDPGSSAGSSQAAGALGGAGALPSGGAMAAGGAAAGAAATGGSVGTCTSHGDCMPGSACVSNVCQACATAGTQCPATCPTGFSNAVVERNGCSLCECVPPSTCTANQDCAANEVCYPGAQCQEGCSTPDCCFGNHCSAAGCGSTVGLNCGAVGCPAGGTCFSVCAAPSCTCDGASWQCQGDGSAGSSGSCPWVCTAPQ